MTTELDTFNAAFLETTNLDKAETASFGLFLDIASRDNWIIAEIKDGWGDNKTLVAKTEIPYPNERMGMDVDYLLWETLGRMCGEDYLNRRNNA